MIFLGSILPLLGKVFTLLWMDENCVTCCIYMKFVKLFGLSGLLHPNVSTDLTLMISLTGEYYQEIQ